MAPRAPRTPRSRCPARGPAGRGGRRARRASRAGPAPPAPAAGRPRAPAGCRRANRRSAGCGLAVMVSPTGIAFGPIVLPASDSAGGEEQRRELPDDPPVGLLRERAEQIVGGHPGLQVHDRDLPPERDLRGDRRRHPAAVDHHGRRVEVDQQLVEAGHQHRAAMAAGCGAGGSRSSTVTSAGTPSASKASCTVIGSGPVATVMARMRSASANAVATGASRATSGRLPAMSRTSWSWSGSGSDARAVELGHAGVLPAGGAGLTGSMECEPGIDQASRGQLNCRFRKGENHSDGRTPRGLSMTESEMLGCDRVTADVVQW